MLRKTYAVWDDCALMIYRPTKSMLRYLTMVVKEITPGGDIKRTTHKQYTVLSEKPFVVQTLQGFAAGIKEIGERDLIPGQFSFRDMRVRFPSPDVRLMRGMRFQQRPVTIKALLKHQSGLISLPTRYGKTYCMVNAIRAYPRLRPLVVIPGRDLLRQTMKTFEEEIKTREIVQIGGGSRKRYQSKHGITVCSADSLHKIDPGGIDWILADEPHSLVTETRMENWQPLMHLRRIGFGATLQGRFDGKDKLITGLFGPVLSEVTYLEAVEEGAICPITIIFCKIPINATKWFYSRNQAYDFHLYLNPTRAGDVARICKEVIPPELQTLIFISHEKQADLYLETLGQSEGVIAMAKKLTDKERNDVFDRMSSGEIKRCYATNIYAQGTTFSDLRVMINAEGGGNNTSAIQKPGRLCEIMPGKNRGIVIDFLFVPDTKQEGRQAQDSHSYALVRDADARMTAYTEKGYEVVVVSTMRELKEAFDARI